MIVQTTTYTPRQGWSIDLPTALDSPNTLLILFADPDLLTVDSSCHQSICAAFPQSTLIGCSATTPFLNGQIESGKAVLSICQFEKSQLKTILQQFDSPTDSLKAGQAIGKSLYRPDLALILLFADDQVVNTNELMDGINSTTPRPVLVSGAMAFHPDFDNGKRLLVWGRQIQNHGVVAVGLYGKSLVVQQDETVGLRTHSEVYEITRATERVIYEINHRPALDVFRDFLGDLASYLDFTNIFPVAFFAQQDSPMHVVRSVLNIDKTARTLIFVSDLPKDRYVRFMVGLPSQFVDSARAIATNVGQKTSLHNDKSKLLALTMSCICRQWALGDEVAQEPAAAFAALPAGTTQIGFYGYGEIALNGVGYCEVHNHTITITLVGEQ